MEELTSAADMMFYKISIVNKSFLRASNCTFDAILGSFIYVSGSTVIIERQSTIMNLNNIDSETELFFFDTSSVEISDTVFKRLHQSYVTPIVRL